MMQLAFWFLYISAPALTVFLLHVAGERLTRINIVTITTGALFVFSIIGTLPLFYAWDEYRYEIGVQDQELILKVLFYSATNIVFFLFGIIFFRRVAGLKPIEYRSQDMHPLKSLQILFLFVLFFVCALVLFDYLTKVDQIAIVVALFEGANFAVEARSSMGNSFTGSYHWYSLFMHDIGSLITFTLFALWLKKRNTKFLILFVVSLFYSIFAAVMAVEKAPLVWLLVGIFFVYSLAINNGNVSLKNIAILSFFLIVIMMFSYMILMGAPDLISAISFTFSRAFAGSISPAYFYLEFFPEHQDYLMGRTFPNPLGLMPYEPYRYTIEVMNWLFPSLASAGIVGSAPTVFWGEAYANFGPTGVPMVAFIVGCLTASVSYLVSKIEISPLTIGFNVFLILFFKDLSITGFSGYLYSVTIIAITLVTLLVIGINGKIRIRKKLPRVY
jgi:oligosaccharide repeat unit polymerase